MAQEELVSVEDERVLIVLVLLRVLEVPEVVIEVPEVDGAFAVRLFDARRSFIL